MYCSIVHSVGYCIIKNEYYIVVDSSPSRAERMGGAVPLLPLYSFNGMYRESFTFAFYCVIVELSFLAIKSLINSESLVVRWPSVAHYYHAF
jgi:hypothetical protein